VNYTARGIEMDGVRKEVDALLFGAPAGEPLSPMLRS
jgi:hypothetical protein